MSATVEPFPSFSWRSALSGNTAILLSLALAKLLIHLATNALGGYGVFRDELYYLACADHLDLGYVDQPPLSIYLLAVSRLMFGDSLFAIRFIPAVAGSVVVFLTGLMAREFGGGRVAQVLAAVCAIVCPILLGISSVYSMNPFDFFFWSLAAYLAIRLLKTEDPRYWLGLGLVLGLGALNKISIFWYAAGLTAGFGLTRFRTWFLTPWPYIAGALSALIFSPFILWNISHDFAHLEFIRNATAGKYSGLSALTFLADQFMIHNPVIFPLWFAGLLFLLFSSHAKVFRTLGIAYLIVLTILLINQHSKGEYLSPAYPVLFAAGATQFERFTRQRTWRWLRPVYACLLLISGSALAPFALPVLPVEQYIRYSERLGLSPSTPEGKTLEALPQFYADMHGWPEKVAAVAAAYQRLTPEEKARCAVFADNYGRCGALDYYGRHYGLPKSIGKHNNYWIWGPREYTGDLVLILGGELRDKQEHFAQVEVVGSVSSPYCMPYENNLKIFLCRGLQTPLHDLWKSLKHYE
jgi:hypothetical protein